MPHSFPFRLGTTSYIIPADLADNAAHLAAEGVNDMELVLFHTADGMHNTPDADMIRRLARIAADHDLTYTVHLPFDLRFDPARAHPSLDHAAHVIGVTAPLRPHAWVFHLETRRAGDARWVEDGIRAIETLLPLVDDPRALTLENLESDLPEALEPVFAALPIARALDIGHVWKMGRDPLPVMARWLPWARVVHLHGVRAAPDGLTDHCALHHTPRGALIPVRRALRGWRGVLTLEVFEADYATSRATLDSAWEQIA